MQYIKAAIQLIAAQLGRARAALNSDPVAGQNEHPITRSRIARWAAAVMALAIALAPRAASAQEDSTVTVSGKFSMDYVNSESDLYWFVPELDGIYENGNEHTWTLTLHGATQSHYSDAPYFGTQIYATSFNLEFFGPDAAMLNAAVSNRLTGAEVSVYLQNTYYDLGGGFAMMYVWVSKGDPGMYFYTSQEMGSLTLFPADQNGYPVVTLDPFSIEPDTTELGYSDMLSSTGGAIGSLAGPVTFEGNVVSVPPTPPTLSIGDASVVEGDRGSRQIYFTVSRSGSTEGAVGVSYRTVDGSASAKSDYKAASGSIVLQPGVLSQTITITVTGDRKREPNETFTVELFNAVGASVTDALGTGTILNDD